MIVTCCRGAQGVRRELEAAHLLFNLTNTEPFAVWFVVTGDATPDGIRVMWSVLGAISSLSNVALARMSPDYCFSLKWSYLTGGAKGARGCPDDGLVCVIVTVLFMPK